jgi:hypothetical protein
VLSKLTPNVPTSNSLKLYLPSNPTLSLSSWAWQCRRTDQRHEPTNS